MKSTFTTHLVQQPFHTPSHIVPQNDRNDQEMLYFYVETCWFIRKWLKKFRFSRVGDIKFQWNVFFFLDQSYASFLYSWTVFIFFFLSYRLEYLEDLGGLRGSGNRLVQRKQFFVSTVSRDKSSRIYNLHFSFEPDVKKKRSLNRQLFFFWFFFFLQYCIIRLCMIQQIVLLTFWNWWF